MVGVLRADNMRIFGWARLKERPEVPAQVEIFIDDKKVAVVAADEVLPEFQLAQRRIGTGRHGFSIPTPAEIKDGQPHVIKAQVVGTNYSLWASPLTVTLKKTE
jgi:hypothetical protein